MKKIISLILCVALIALVLVSCGDDEHVHEYNRNEWASDATNHWHKATCDCKDAGTVDLAKHIDEMSDGYCDVCNYLLCNKTTYVLNHNEYAHWQEAECGHTGPSSHLPTKNETIVVHQLDDNGVCSGCTYACMNEDYELEYTTDEHFHWNAPLCGHEGHCPSTKVLHEDNDVNEETEEVVGNGICDVCEYVMCEGEYETDATYQDETNHVYEIKCGHIGHAIKVEAHEDKIGATDADGNDIGDGMCDKCYGEMAEPNA